MGAAPVTLITGSAFAVADSAGTYLGTTFAAVLGATHSPISDALSYLVGAWT